MHLVLMSRALTNFIFSSLFSLYSAVVAADAVVNFIFDAVDARRVCVCVFGFAYVGVCVSVFVNQLQIYAISKHKFCNGKRNVRDNVKFAYFSLRLACKLVSKILFIIIFCRTHLADGQQSIEVEQQEKRSAKPNE